MDETDEPIPLESADPGMREILGMFDVPAFARRGQDVEFVIARLHARCRRERDAMLEMVRMRLRQWASAGEGPESWRGYFAAPLDDLWAATAADAPAWASSLASPRRRRAIARDLRTSVERFNRRWARFLDGLNLDPINSQIDQYNRHYVFEKECLLSSARLAARHFVPKEPIRREALAQEYPPLPVPEPL